MPVIVERPLSTEVSITRIKESIEHDCRYTLGALLLMYKEHTKGVYNFTTKDAPLLCGFAKQYERDGSLLKKQLIQAQTRLIKYASAIAKLGGLEPIKIPTNSNHFISSDNGRLLVKFDSKEIYGHITKTVKTINQHRFVNNKNYWTVPNNAYNLEVLFCTGVKWKVDKKVYEEYKHTIKSKKKLPVKGISAELRDYQKDALYYVNAKGGRALIGDDMGLGKSVTSIAYVTSKDLYPAIIICPASLKLNWKREIERWVINPGKIEILKGETPHPIDKDTKFIIINYDIIYFWADALLKMNPQITIIDEVQYIKNSESRTKVSNPKPGEAKTKKVPIKRTAGTVKVGRKTPCLIALSGTPIENRVIEFFNSLNLIKKDYFPSRWKFAERYADLKPNMHVPGWDDTGRSNTRELYTVLSKLVMIRRTKDHVLKELPEMNRILVPIEMSDKHWNQYVQVEEDFLRFLREKYKDVPIEKLMNKSNVLTKISALRQICATGKMENSIGWIKDQLEVHDKLVVFTYHRQTAEDIKKTFGSKCELLVGGMTAQQKDTVMSNFQKCKTCGVLHHYHAADDKACDEFVPNDKCPLLIANIAAAAEGVNFTAASNAAMVEYQYNPAKLQQAEARLHRSGQTNKTFISYLVAANTIEERIMNSIDTKMKTVEEVVDGTNSEGLMGSFLKDALV